MYAFLFAYEHSSYYVSTAWGAEGDAMVCEHEAGRRVTGASTEKI